METYLKFAFKFKLRHYTMGGVVLGRPQPAPLEGTKMTVLSHVLSKAD
jgi:hypothetical protein